MELDYLTLQKYAKKKVRRELGKKIDAAVFTMQASSSTREVFKKDGVLLIWD